MHPPRSAPPRFRRLTRTGRGVVASELRGLALVVLVVAGLAACSDPPSPDAVPSLASSTVATGPASTAAPTPSTTTTVPVTTTTMPTAPSTTGAPPTIDVANLNPLASESGVVNLAKETVTIRSRIFEADGTNLVGIGPFNRIVGSGKEVARASRYFVDFGPNFLDMEWTDDRNYDIFEGVISDGSSERYTFVFQRNVFKDVVVEFSPRTVIRPEVTIDSPRQITVIIGNGIERGDGFDLRLNFRYVEPSTATTTP